MFTIKIKGKVNSKDLQMVKLEIVFFKTGYARVAKVLNVSGPLKEWNNQSQSFNTSHANATAKNKILFDLKNQYHKAAEEWDAEGRIWSPVELSHCFDEVKVRQTGAKSLTVLQMFDYVIDLFSERERLKNGRIVKSMGNALRYQGIRDSFVKFTQQEYNKAFSSFFFKDITEKFLLDYTMYTKKEGLRNGNKGGLSTKLRRLRAVCRQAEKLNIYGVNMRAFECLGEDIKWDTTTSKAVSYKVFDKLETVDRSLLSKSEAFHLDLFLFSYYTGGMANVDVCNLTWDCIKGDQIVYERMKYTKIAKPLVVNRSRKIIEKYRGEGIEDYVFPVFEAEDQTDIQKMRQVKNCSRKVSRTLKKVCRILKINETLTWYSARGSFISRMVDRGYYVHVVAEMAGNSPDVISKHYYKNTQSEDMLKNMNKMFG